VLKMRIYRLRNDRISRSEWGYHFQHRKCADNRAMGLRFRRSICILPGIRVNFGKRSGSISLGVRGAINTRTTLGLPGTGLSCTHLETPHHAVHVVLPTGHVFGIRTVRYPLLMPATDGSRPLRPFNFATTRIPRRSHHLLNATCTVVALNMSAGWERVLPHMARTTR
jgi:hypothetical protein